MTRDAELLRRYVDTRSDEPFAALVNQYVGLVYSAALRQVGGDAALAQDVVQTVFADLARKARALVSRDSLAAWLYTSTHFAAAKAVRTEQRRRAREREAQMMHELQQTSGSDPDWSRVEPALDQAMHELKSEHREAVILRYFENLAYPEIAIRIGLSENAARMRVERALEKLRARLCRRGITTTAALSTVLSTHAVQTAPASLAAAVTQAAAAGTAAKTTLLFHLITMTTTKTGIAGALLIGCLLAPWLMQQRAAATLRADRKLLQERENAIDRLEAESRRLSNAAQAGARARQDLAELQQLRAEAQAVSPQAAAAAALRRENAQLQSSLAKPGNPLQAKEEIIATELQIRDWLIAFQRYAAANQGLLPSDFDAARLFLPESATNAAGTEFEIVYHGSTVGLENPGNVIVIRQKTVREPLASEGRRGTWSRIYGFADGSVHLQQDADGNFEPYEKAHSLNPGAN